MARHDPIMLKAIVSEESLAAISGLSGCLLIQFTVASKDFAVLDIKNGD